MKSKYRIPANFLILFLVGVVLTSCRPFSPSGEVEVTTEDYSGTVRWQDIGGTWCNVSSDFDGTKYSQPKACSRAIVIRYLKDKLPNKQNSSPDDVSAAVVWLEEAIRTVKSYTGESSGSDATTTAQKPPETELAVVLKVKTNDAQLAVDFYTAVADRWHLYRAEKCNLPKRTGDSGNMQYTGGLKYPESILVVRNPTVYKPETVPEIKIVDAASFNPEEYPAVITIEATVKMVEGPNYGTEAGRTFQVWGLEITGYMELAVRSGSQPLRFEGHTKPEFRSEGQCSGGMDCEMLAGQGSGGIFEFVEQILDKGLDVGLEKAVRETVDCGK